MRGKTLHILIATFLFAIVFSVLSAHAAVVDRITADEAKTQLDTAIFIDSRTGADWSGSTLMIKGAIRGPFDTIETWSASIPKDKAIIVYCA